ncbi:TPA: hypothetical protein L4S94_001253 [Pseudomonas aeruginosa]|nr:hypothetical protein [Pseudomonas aeruginosa]
MNKANECTCPSGDGSLVHPCPAHPAVEQAGGDEHVSLRGAANLAFNALHECVPAGGAEKQYSDAIRALETALRDIAYSVNRTATPQQFSDHLQREARAALAQPSPKCATCGGTGMVDDGEITCSEGGIPYENGPVKCVKDCPDCKAQPSPAQAEAERLEVVGYRIMRAQADKIYQRVDKAAAEYEAGRSALGYMEDIAEAALCLRNRLDYLLATAPAQAQHSMSEEFSFEYRHPNGESHTVTVSRDQVINEMPDFLFEALCSKFCNCEPAGETNVVECCCDEYAEEFKLLAAAPGKEVPQAWLDVQAERRRQVEAEGWTPEHDDQHADGQMAVAAGYYALACGFPHERDIALGHVPQYWPWDARWWKPKDARSNLVRSCALALAEIERLDRACISQSPQPGAATASS